MIDKIKKIPKRHKYSIFIFLFIFVYNFVVVEDFSFPAIDQITYTYHIVDYSVGFCTKLLPGAIYNTIFTTTDAEAVNLYFIVLYHIFLVIVSLMLEKFLYRIDLKSRSIAFVIVLFFVTGPATFSIHTFRLGMLDTYWLFFSVAFLFMIQNRYLKWFVPIVFILSVFVHVSAMVSFIPFFALIILLEVLQNEKERNSYVAIFTVSVVLSVITFLYFVAFEENNLLIDVDSFKNFINERNISEWEDYTIYYDYSLYRKSYVDGTSLMGVTSDDSVFVVRVLEAFWFQIKETFRASSNNGKYITGTFIAIFFSMPIIVFLYKYIFSVLKKEQSNKLKLFVWVCTLCLFPLTFITGSLCSPDIVRWFGHGVMVLFTLILYQIYRYDKEYMDALSANINNHTMLPVIIYFLFYMSYTIDPYC